MTPKKRGPQLGGNCGTSEVVLAGRFDFLRNTSQAHKRQARRRAGFARDMVFESFGYRHARALDYDTFADRAPGPAPWW